MVVGGVVRVRVKKEWGNNFHEGVLGGKGLILGCKVDK